MHRHHLLLYITVILEIFMKEVFSQGYLWNRKHRGLLPSIQAENGKVSFGQCMIRCTHRSTCKAMFHTDDTSQCYIRESVVIKSSELPLQGSPSTVYYEPVKGGNILDEIDPNLPEFQTVLLGDHDKLTFRVFNSPREKQKDAVEICNGFGGHLLHYFTLARRNFFRIMADVMDGPFWIDVTNKHAANFSDINGYTTEDGQPIPRTFWYSTYPSDGLYCVCMGSDIGNLWYTAPCTHAAMYVCEI